MIKVNKRIKLRRERIRKKQMKIYDKRKTVNSDSSRRKGGCGGCGRH